MYGTLVGSMTFAVVGVWMILTGEPFGWIVVVGCGYAGMMIARSLRRPALLELTPLAITVRLGISGRPLRYELRRCGEFRPWGLTLLNRGSLVVFDYDGPLPTPGPAPLRMMNRTLGARDANVPAIFGMSGRNLATLLNEYRAQAQSGG